MIKFGMLKAHILILILFAVCSNSEGSALNSHQQTWQIRLAGKNEVHSKQITKVNFT